MIALTARTVHDREVALKRLRTSRMALGFALAANHRAVAAGRKPPCDQATIGSLTREVVVAVHRGRARGLAAAELSISEATTFHNHSGEVLRPPGLPVAELPAPVR